MRRHEAGWVKVYVGDSFALRQVIRSAKREGGVPQAQLDVVLKLIGDIEATEDSVTTATPPMDKWGIAL